MKDLRNGKNEVRQREPRVRKRGLRFLAILMMAVIAATTLPVFAVPTEAAHMMYPLVVSGVEVQEGHTSGAGWSFDPEGPEGFTLTLDGYVNDGTEVIDYEGLGVAIFYYGHERLTVILKGTNTITGCGRGFYASATEGETGIVTISGSGSLSVTTTDAGIATASSLFVKTTGAITSNAGNWGMKCGNELIIASGTVTSTAKFDGLYSPIVMIKGGTVEATGTDGVGIMAEDFMGAIEPSVNIFGGKVTAKGSTAGIATFGDTGTNPTVIIEKTDNVTPEVLAYATDTEDYAFAIHGNVRNNYTGTGWSDAAGTKGAKQIPVTTSVWDLTYKRVQFPEATTPTDLTIKFAAGDGSGNMDDVTIKAGDSYKLPSTCSFTPPAGKKFAGWNINGKFYKPGTELSWEQLQELMKEGVITITAAWEDDAPTTYTIQFAAGDGSGNMDQVTIKEGDSYTLPTTCGFTPPAGKKFAGWNINGQFYPPGSVLNWEELQKLINEGVITITAVWADEDAATVTVSPEAKSLVYTGSPQELVNAGQASGGTLVYALGTDATTIPADDAFTDQIPTAAGAGTYYVWFKAKGDQEHTDGAPACVVATIAEPTPAGITTLYLPDAVAGYPYVAQLEASGTGPIKWSVEGTLPAGLTLDESTGIISGTPTATGTSTFTIKAQNAAGVVTKEFMIRVELPGAGSDNESGCVHSFEWVVTKQPTKTEDGVESYRCSKCGVVQQSQAISAMGYFMKEFKDAVKNAKSGATVTINANPWVSVNREVIEAIKARPDLTINVQFSYKNSNYQLTIPANTDLSGAFANKQEQFVGFFGLESRTKATVTPVKAN